jgi:cardiolipin synthase
VIRDLWNVPNIISLARLALIPIFLWLIVAGEYGWAGILFGFIGATDWIDGYAARRLGQVTEVGKFLDPLADRLAVAVAVIGGLLSGVLPTWFAWAIIVREALIAVGAVYGWRHGVTKLDVRWLGKAATFGLYFSVAFIFVGRGFDVEWLENLAIIGGVPALVMYYWVGFDYVGDMRKAIAAAR